MVASSFQITMRSGPTPGKTFPLEREEIHLGRDLANEIAINDPEISRRHARFFLRDENIYVEDLGSTNGTFLNGERISTPQQLRSGDVITFGENIVVVFEKAIYDPDATVVATHEPPTFKARKPEPQYYQPTPEPQAYQPVPEPVVYQQPQPQAQRVVEYPPQEPVPGAVKPKKAGLPTWLIVLIVAIVVILCVIAVTLYFMPASWWCAITFDMLEGCPLP